MMSNLRIILSKIYLEFKKINDASEPHRISIAATSRAIFLVIIWLSAAALAFEYSKVQKDFVKDGGIILIASALAGFAAMLASLNAFFAAALKAEDERRKDHYEKTQKKRNTLLKAEQSTRMLERKLTLSMYNFQRITGCKDLKFNKVECILRSSPIPAQLIDCWNDLSLLPESALSPLRNLTSALQELSEIIDYIQKYDEGETFPAIMIMTRIEWAMEESAKLTCILGDTINYLPAGQTEIMQKKQRADDGIIIKKLSEI